MSNLKEQVKDICRLADAVVENPTISLSTTAVTIGVSSAVVGFASGVAMVFSPIIILPACVSFWVAKKNNKHQEKERMLREVIRKQQAVINKLNEELACSCQQNAQNREEIKTLKKMLEMLVETEKYLKTV